jgi:hypothetical protein
MNTLKLILALAFGAYAACSKIDLPTDFSTVASGTRANLKANFDEIDSRSDACFDSTDEVRARMSGYTGDFTITSLDNLRLRLDSDGSTAGKFVVMSSNLDSLFRVSEDTTARFFRHLAIDSNLTVGGAATITGALTLTAAPVFTPLTASRLMATNGSKAAASVSDLTSWIAGTANQITSTSDGDGSLTLSLPSAVTFPGSVSVTTTLGVTGTSTMAGINASGDITTSRSNAGGNVVLTVTNSETANAASHAQLQVLSGGASGGDAFTRYSVTGVNTWSTGIDNSDGDAYVITPTSTPGGATNGLKITTGGAATIPGTLDVTGKLTGSDTIAAALGFRAGSAGATDAQLYRSGSNMWTTPDSLTVAGRVAVTGTLTADSLISPKFYEEGTYTATLTGVSGSVTGTARYVRIGKQVTLYIPTLTGTSNSTACTVTGAPASIRPARQQYFPINDMGDNNNLYPGMGSMGTGGTIGFAFWQTITTYQTTFTSSNLKGPGAFVATYSLL